jgi:hypothetical protein
MKLVVVLPDGLSRHARNSKRLAHRIFDFGATLRPAPEFRLTPRGNGSRERSRGAAARIHGPILHHRGKRISGHAAGFEPTSQARVDICRIDGLLSKLIVLLWPNG